MSRLSEANLREDICRLGATARPPAKGFREAMKENGDGALDQMQRHTAHETYKYVQDMLTPPAKCMKLSLDRDADPRRRASDRGRAPARHGAARRT